MSLLPSVLSLLSVVCSLPPISLLPSLSPTSSLSYSFFQFSISPIPSFPYPLSLLYPLSISYQLSALSSLFHFSLLSRLPLLSPIPSFSSPFLPSLLSPIHYLSYILSQFSLFSSLSLLQYLCLSSTPLPSIIRYPLILSLDTLTSVSLLHSPSSLLSHIPTFPSPISAIFYFSSPSSQFCLLSLIYLLSIPSSSFFFLFSHSLSPLPDLSPSSGGRVSGGGGRVIREGGEREGKWGGREVGG